MNSTMWQSLPSEEVINKTVKNLENRGFVVHVVDTKQQALEKVKELLPADAEVANGTSTTLSEVGVMDYLENGDHKYQFWGTKIRAENDEAKRGQLRKEALLADYFLGSVNAITQEGELISVDATGSRVSGYAFAANHLLLVVGANKIVDSLDDAFKRIREHVFPLENERAKIAYGGMGSTFGKWLIYEREVFKGRTTVILVKELLGY